jgi:hypothetical protein
VRGLPLRQQYLPVMVTFRRSNLGPIHMSAQIQNLLEGKIVRLRSTQEATNEPHPKRRISMPKMLWIAGHEPSSSLLQYVIRHSSRNPELLMTIICNLKVVSFLGGFITESQTLTFAIFGGTLATVLLVRIPRLSLVEPGLSTNLSSLLNGCCRRLMPQLAVPPWPYLNRHPVSWSRKVEEKKDK